MQKVSLTSIVWKEGDYFVAQCLNIDISSFGNTRKEALKNLNEAIELYFDGTNNLKVQKILRPQIVTDTRTYA